MCCRGSRVRELVCVVGMHRSGTSATAGALAHLGVDFGPPHQLMPATPDNPKGYYESMPVVQLHDRLLRANGGSWDHPPELPACTPAWQLAQRALVKHLSTWSSPVIGVKDPRMCLVPLLWAQVAVGLGRELRLVAVVRDSVATTASLMKRDGMTEDEAAALGTTYTNGVRGWAQMLPASRMLVEYEKLLRNPSAELWVPVQKLVRGLRCVDVERIQAMEKHVDPELNRCGS